MRILVTGSRDWTDEATIGKALCDIDADNRFTDMILVSGACPTGADIMAEDIAKGLGWTIERHPADWEKYGKRAGYLRNAEMVNLHWDVCLVFNKNDSPGTTMTEMLVHSRLAHYPTRKVLVWRED